MDPTQNSYGVSQDMSQADLPAPASPQFNDGMAVNSSAQSLPPMQAGLPHVDTGPQVSAQVPVGMGIVAPSQTSSPVTATIGLVLTVTVAVPD